MAITAHFHASANTRFNCLGGDDACPPFLDLAEGGSRLAISCCFSTDPAEHQAFARLLLHAAQTYATAVDTWAATHANGDDNDGAPPEPGKAA